SLRSALPSVSPGSGTPCASIAAPPIRPRSISQDSPPRWSASSTLSASPTTSGPMPSPGRIRMRAVMSVEQPGRFLPAARLVRADGGGVLQRQADLVEPFDQVSLAQRVELEARIDARPAHALCGQVYIDRDLRIGRHRGE